MQKYIDDNLNEFLSQLSEFLKIKSVSTDSKCFDNCLNCANYLNDFLLKIGMDSKVMETKGIPVVFAEKRVDASKPTVLIYGHYDVQPAEIVDGWDHDPFEMKIKGEKIYARGAADDKGQVFMHLKVLEYFSKNDTWPVNIKLLIEGEEEIGSVNLEDFILNNKEMLSADLILISDTSIISNTQPSITAGVRGMASFEVLVKGPKVDVHSGVYGGMIDNPNRVLSVIISKMKDENGKILIPGFYDGIKEYSQVERAAFQEVFDTMVDSDAVANEYSVLGCFPEEGYSPYESASIRPTFDVVGMYGGYLGEGVKTIIPNSALAKFSFRLVSGQDPERITHLAQEYIRKISPKTLNVEFIDTEKSSSAYATDLNSKAYLLAAKAMEENFGNKCLPVMCGGSIPVASIMKNHLNLETIFMGFGLEEDNIHSPNESYGIFNFKIGIKTIHDYLILLAENY